MTSRILLAATAVAFIATSISAYQLLSPRRTWQNTPTYIVDNGNLAGVTNPTTKVINAITSTDAWNGAGTVRLVEAEPGPMGTNFVLGDGVPMLNFSDPTGQCSGNCLAATFTGFYTRQGKNVRIVDADIVTNTSHPWTSVGDSCSNEFYIEGVQVHEIGHGLGLGHSSVSGATMFPSVGACDNGPATTEADDEAGICDLYDCGGGCSLGQKGDSCSSNGDCCSGKCRGGACR